MWDEVEPTRRRDADDMREVARAETVETILSEIEKILVAPAMLIHLLDGE